MLLNGTDTLPCLWRNQIRFHVCEENREVAMPVKWTDSLPCLQREQNRFRICKGNRLHYHVRLNIPLPRLWRVHILLQMFMKERNSITVSVKATYSITMSVKGTDYITMSVKIIDFIDMSAKRTDSILWKGQIS